MQRDCSAEMILCDDFGGEVVDEWRFAFFRGDFERRAGGGEHASFASDGERSYSREKGHPGWLAGGDIVGCAEMKPQSPVPTVGETAIEPKPRAESLGKHVRRMLTSRGSDVPALRSYTRHKPNALSMESEPNYRAKVRILPKQQSPLFSFRSQAVLYDERRQDGKAAGRQSGRTAKRQDGKTARRQGGKAARRQDGKMA